ncbi:hypothetical protein KO527_05030 [Pseudoalteromonas sp. C2R02]|uniref:SNF2-related protein n=1 Tax=Pseudoalteromonas sp. C2R02 TaxID=2841565 RepID=UPI001C098C8B|nr:SNF2-related protein [Pseudoalteromonas sp. C2R02]MBU2968710.1 hypothetical protein [Pseudoalteromonas sp. C2R02]
MSTHIISEIEGAKTAIAVFNIFDLAFGLVTPKNHTTSKNLNANFGVDKIKNVSIKRTRENANETAKEILQRHENGESLTQDDLIALRAYTGLGGIGSSINEYYTPQYIAEGTWNALKANGFENGNVCEPSCGAGVFNGTKPSGTVITGSEIDKTSSTINSILHPEDSILNQPFETLATNVSDGHFDSFVGNVPFGDTRGKFAALDPEYAKVKNIEQYFLSRAIDKTKAGGLMAFVVPTQIVSRPAWSKWRESISLKAEFLGAHRLPSGTFANNGTDTVTDIILLKKHSDDVFEKIANADKDTLIKSNVLWNTWLKGKWFDKEGKRFVFGDQSTEGEGQFKRLVVKNNQLSNEAIKNKLSHKFDSRIDYTLLNTVETQTVNYAEGDTRLMNDRWYTLEDGKWQLKEFRIIDGKLDSNRFGTDTVEELKQVLSSEEQALSLSFTHANNVKNTLSRDMMTSHVSAAIELANTYPVNMQEQVYRGMLIGSMVEDLLENKDQYNYNQKREQIAALVEAEKDRYGIATNDNSLTSVNHKHAKTLNNFVRSTDKNGKLSDLLSGKSKGEAKHFDMSTAKGVVEFLFGEEGVQPVSIEQFNEHFDGVPPALHEILKDSNIALATDGTLWPMDRFTSGDVRRRIGELTMSISLEEDEAIKAKYIEQVAIIQSKRKVTSVDDMTISMSSKWTNRKYVIEFLKSKGHDLKHDDEIAGKSGEFNSGSWYQEPSRFEKQITNYLNGQPVRGGANGGAIEYKKQIANLDKEFAIWIRQHDDIDLISEDYNIAFNGFIPFAHSEADLKLTKVSGLVKNMGFQNSGIRQMSEDGRGILGFGTGMGKSHTANGLAAYDLQMGRCTKVCYSVPKSTLTNWYHEVKQFFGDQRRVYFIGLEVVKDKKSGEVIRDPWLDKDGNHKKNEHTGELEYRDQVKELNGKAVAARMATLPHENYEIVVMTKEQLAKIPMRPQSKEKFVDDMVSREMLSDAQGVNAVVGAGVSLERGSYKQAKKQARFQEKYSANQTTKSNQYPFWEDMGFDKLIVDEGHNFRNSFKAGREASRLAFLPTSGVAKSATDLAIKSNYLRAKNGGKGVHLLTATPTVNSPTDVFNMLSLVLSPEEWEQYGIHNVDDFIRIFGKTEIVQRQKLSGAIEDVEGLVGFKNLDALRGLFHRWVIAKEAKDVKADVVIPDKVNEHHKIPLNEEQEALYEELRERADNLLDAEDEEGNPTDFIFSIIRDMDRVVSDVDLFYKRITYILPKSDHEKLSQLASDLPPTKTITVMKDGEKEKVDVENEANVSIEDGKAVLVVNEEFEDEVTKRLKEFDIDKTKVMHPVTPKYAKLLAELKKDYEAGGKQVIFSEEKRQHQKIKRLIANTLNIPDTEIGIINGDTVSKGKSNSDLDKEMAALEDIADKYNTGSYRILICNKKAEVGINLQHGSTRLHHLTLPWTPASIKQRDGRVIRIGGKQKQVNINHYLAEGSFDEFRLRALNSKAAWQEEIFNGTSSEQANDQSDDIAQARLLLSKNPEELKARMADAKKAAEQKALENNKIRSGIALHTYIKLSKRPNKTPKQKAKIKELRPTIEHAIKEGYLSVKPSVLDNVSSVGFDSATGKAYQVGGMYEHSKESYGYKTFTIYEINSFNAEESTLSATVIHITGSRNGLKKGSVTTVTLKDAVDWIETKYTASEIELKEFWSEKQKPRTVAASSLINEDVFKKYVNKDNYYPNYFGIASVWNGREIEFVQNSSLDNYDNLVFPDPNNANTKKAFAQTMLVKLRDNASRNESDQDMAEVLFGKDWREAVEATGNVATDNQIIEWLANASKVFLESDKYQELAAEPIRKNWRGIVDNSHVSADVMVLFVKAFPTEFDNTMQFRKASITESKRIADLIIEQKAVLQRQAEEKLAAEKLKNEREAQLKAEQDAKEQQEAASKPFSDDTELTPDVIESRLELLTSAVTSADLWDKKPYLYINLVDPKAVKGFKTARGRNKGFKLYIDMSTLTLKGNTDFKSDLPIMHSRLQSIVNACEAMNINTDSISKQINQDKLAA